MSRHRSFELLRTGEASCIYSKGKDILIGRPQSLFFIDDFLSEFLGGKWLRMTEGNVVGTGRSDLRRIQIGELGDASSPEDSLSVIVGQYYWMSYEQVKEHLKSIAGN